MSAAAVAERVARESYGRLLALLAARTRDLAAAEDALSDAFSAALAAWPRGSVPANPEAWLFAAARRKLIDGVRRGRTIDEGMERIRLGLEELEAEMSERPAPDRRLELMFACTHPDIEEGVRTPLILQAVLGFSAQRIASAFLVEPAAMGKRLVRAKERIRKGRIAFEVPPPATWTSRLGAVLDAIYAAYGWGWSDALGADPERRGLPDEAMWLAAVLCAQTRGEPEPLGLLALMLHLEARRPARRDADGRYVPLEQQDVRLWRCEQIAEAETLLRKASEAGRPGRYQLEAAIQSALAARLGRGEADWDALVQLHEALSQLTGSPVARLNLAAARARRDGAEAGLAALARLDVAALRDYQPYWALSADLLAQTGRLDEAKIAYAEAMARERDIAVVRFLAERRAALDSECARRTRITRKTGGNRRFDRDEACEEKQGTTGEAA